MSVRVRLALVFSAVILLSQAFSLPSPVLNVASGLFEQGYHLQYTGMATLFAPFFMLAESITLLGAYGSYALVGWVLLGAIWSLGWFRGALAVLLFMLFVAWGALVPKPMARLVAENKDILLVDFHSHSRVSHDGRPSFTADANRQWHMAQGYQAAFITDHNRVESALEAKESSRNDWSTRGYSSLQGEEISLKKTHLVVLGNKERIDNQPFDSDAAKIPLFIAEMHRRGLPVIASLPEYWLYHWGEGVQDLLRWGIDGFEVVNSAPKALDFPKQKRNQVLDLCSTQNRFITGISDNHGYGYATAAWNAMLIPGWQAMNPDLLESTILKVLKRDGYKAVQVLERARFQIPSPVWGILAPFVSLFLLWRSLSPVMALSWVAWIWIFAILYSSFSKPAQRSGPKA